MTDRLLLKSWVFAIAFTLTALSLSYFSLSDLLLYSVPVLFFSLVTFLLRERIFIPWFRITIIWLPVSILIILSIPGNTTFFGPSEQEILLLLSFAVYTVISFFTIIIQSVRVYWLKK